MRLAKVRTAIWSPHAPRLVHVPRLRCTCRDQSACRSPNTHNHVSTLLDTEVVLSEVEGQAAYCVAQGNDVCLLQGTTGEWPSLSLNERIELATEWRRCVPHGSAMKLILHIGHDALPDAKSLARLASELKYDGVLLSPPSKFVAANVEAQVACLAEVLKHCAEVPAFYYHYPTVYRDTFDLIEVCLTKLKRAVHYVVWLIIASQRCISRNSNHFIRWKADLWVS